MEGGENATDQEDRALAPRHLLALRRPDESPGGRRHRRHHLGHRFGWRKKHLQVFRRTASSKLKMTEIGTA